MHHRFSIESKYENVVLVSDDIHKFCAENGVSEDDCTQLEICLMEALNNVIRHAYKETAGKLIEIDVLVADEKIIVTIFDTGLSRTSTEKATLEFDPDDIEHLPEGGMGLFIIESIMDSTEYLSEDGTNKYTMVKEI